MIRGYKGTSSIINLQKQLKKKKQNKASKSNERYVDN